MSATEPRGHGLVIVGAGGHGRVCAEIAAASGWRVLGFCDQAQPSGARINGVEVLARDLVELAGRTAAVTDVAIAIGDNARRMALAEEVRRYNWRLPVLVHPSAVVSPTAVIGEGSVLAPGVILNANARVGRLCILNTACSIDHDGVLEDGAQICPGVRAAGNVTFGSASFIGTGAVLIPGVRVGARAVVAAGATVVRDVPDGALVAGTPAVVKPRGV